MRTAQSDIDETRRVVAHIERGEPAEAAAVWRRHLVFVRDEMLGRTPAATT